MKSFASSLPPPPPPPMGQIWSAIFGREVQENPSVKVLEDHYAEQQREFERKMQECAKLSEQAQRASKAQQQAHAKLQQQISEHDEKMQDDRRSAALAREDAAKMHAEAIRAREEQESRLQREREDCAAARREVEEKVKADLLAGIRPDVMPTREEFEAMKAARQYDKHNIHFAIVGSAGTGKSTLVNAIRGLHPEHEHAAPTGETETTRTVERYQDTRPSSKGRVWWYDVPGGGTRTVPGANYFNDQGLYVFDAILVVFAGRFTELDLVILRHTYKWGIPAYIVRSKADQDIQNRMERAQRRANALHENREPVIDEEKQAFICEVHDNVRKSLEEEGLSELAAATDARCFVVSESAILRCIKDMDSDKGLLDGMEWTSIGKSKVVTDPRSLDFEEKKLLRQLVHTTAERRVVDKDVEWLQSIVKDWKVPNWTSQIPKRFSDFLA
ncbi:P-loop containing nucleoside triphosphate hydrolase protein [Cylindrobasidium torrendii FP15055 ss-10]|uniref:p-loop containing nucleoside triphosphate hydrolase protein n=1 Tax=Cylindrobasidium torrendii FP15055 ss-10 TaxID=1314674 RepID=A0A0D7B050_9AGAR|nr:P-loop containing nucleoside triphosphate hydrolase protein [Cylindrobasidium torrendii FP15055 ss-10]